MKKIHASIFGAAITIIGLAASVAQLFPRQQELVNTLLVFSVLTFPIGYAAYYFRRRTERGDEQPTLLPPQDIETTSKRCGRIEICAAREEDIEIVALQERQAYKAEDAVPFSVLQAWFRRNPSGFSCFKVRGELAGHFNIIAPKAESLKMLVEGAMVEREVEAESLWPLKDRLRIRNLYVESIAMPGSSEFVKGFAMHCLLQNFESLIARCADPRQLKRVYAMAATDRGEYLVRTLGFRVCRPAGARRDNHNLFVCEYPKLKSMIAEYLAKHEAMSVPAHAPAPVVA